MSKTEWSLTFDTATNDMKISIPAKEYFRPAELVMAQKAALYFLDSVNDILSECVLGGTSIEPVKKERKPN